VSLFDGHLSYYGESSFYQALTLVAERTPRAKMFVRKFPDGFLCDVKCPSNAFCPPCKGNERFRHIRPSRSLNADICQSDQVVKRRADRFNGIVQSHISIRSVN
jgi:hypothetical protein